MWLAEVGQGLITVVDGVLDFANALVDAAQSVSTWVLSTFNAALQGGGEALISMIENIQIQ